MAQYVPSPYPYTVIRMEPVAVAEHLNDSEALKSANVDTELHGPWQSRLRLGLPEAQAT